MFMDEYDLSLALNAWIEEFLTNPNASVSIEDAMKEFKQDRSYGYEPSYGKNVARKLFEIHAAHSDNKN